MPTYVVLNNWTDQGIRTIKESPRRLDATKKAIEAAGGKAMVRRLLADFGCDILAYRWTSPP